MKVRQGRRNPDLVRRSTVRCLRALRKKATIVHPQIAGTFAWVGYGTALQQRRTLAAAATFTAAAQEKVLRLLAIMRFVAFLLSLSGARKSVLSSGCTGARLQSAYAFLNAKHALIYEGVADLSIIAAGAGTCTGDSPSWRVIFTTVVYHARERRPIPPRAFHSIATCLPRRKWRW